MTIPSDNSAAIWGVGGILLGGGLTNLRDWFLRRAEAKAVDAALTAEVRALLETIEVRGLFQSLASCRIEVERLIAEGKTGVLAAFPQFSATWNYFGMFDTMLPKLGLLSRKRVALLTRFYLAARSSSEMLMRRPGSAMQPMPLDRLLGHLFTEEALAGRVIALGHEIVGATIVTPAANTIDRASMSSGQPAARPDGLAPSFRADCASA